MTTIADFTSPSLIVPQLRTRDTAGVLGELCAALHRQGAVTDLLPFYNSSMSRELLCNSVMEPGWALPHARFPGLQRLCFAVGRSEAGLNWLGKEPVRLIFLFAVPEAEAGTYLNLISSFARLSCDSMRCERLLQASDGDGMFEVLQDIPLRRPVPISSRK